MEETYIGIEILKVMENAKAYNNSLAELAISCIDYDVLDFGAGIGTISDILRLNGKRVSCLETNFEEINILKQKNYNVFSDVNDIPDNSISSIVSYNVFEHIENDKEVIKQVYRILKKGGTFFVLVPACQKLYSAFDKRLGHLRRYEREDFVELLISAGFEIKSLRYFDSLGYITAAFYKLFHNSGELTKNQVLVFDKLVFPLSKLFDKFFGKRFGKNLYAVAYK